MNGRRRRRIIRILRGDILVMALLIGAMLGAWLYWPQKAVADIAIPMALLIAFVEWRRRRW
jgi:hypothetical protein